MLKLLRASVLALLGLAVSTPLALAEKTSSGRMSVKDAADVFSPNKVAEAEGKFSGTTFKTPTSLFVHTVAKVPDDKRADYEKVKGEKAAKRSFMRDWANQLADAESEKGVFVLVCQEARAIEVVASRKTDLYRHFTDADANKMYDILAKGFREAEESKAADADKKVIRGETLVKATSFVIDQLKDTTVPDSKKASGVTHTVKEKTGMGIGSWICIGLCVLLGVWVVIALIRALTGAGGGGYGGGGYGGPGFGGGGGGFMTSMLGGMFGAAAGMWMYNNMFGGSHANDMSAGESLGSGGEIDTGADDYGGGAEGGGDWGDSGGDTGGGGDWGDSGGGGDWGGGGGDFGGGGGDW